MSSEYNNSRGALWIGLSMLILVALLVAVAIWDKA